MIKLWGRTNSLNVQKVLWTLAELDVRYQRTDAGLRVPEDIPVVGYDDIQLSAFTMPPLTTVSLPRSEISNAAFRALLNAQHVGAKKTSAGRRTYGYAYVCTAEIDRTISTLGFRCPPLRNAG